MRRRASSWTVVNPNYKDPYVMSYNVALQQDFGRGWVADFAYVGNQGRHVPAYYNINAGVVAGAGSSGQPENATFGRTARTDIMAWGTNSNYNGLQVKLTHRFQNGLSWTSGLAWQKSMGFISSTTGLARFNFYLDPRRDYAPLNWDRRVTYSQSFIYELPFGKNKPMLQQGIGSALLGGWQVSSVMSADTGMPLFLTASANSLNAPDNTQVPNQVKPFHKLGSIGAAQAMVRHDGVCAADDSSLWQHAEERLYRAGNGDAGWVALPHLPDPRGAGSCSCARMHSTR